MNPTSKIKNILKTSELSFETYNEIDEYDSMNKSLSNISLNNLNNSQINHKNLIQTVSTKNKLEEKYCFYDIEHLDKNLKNVKKFSNSVINICCFTISKRYLYPSLFYLLFKTDNILTFPFFKNKNTLDILSDCKKRLCTMNLTNYNFKGYMQLNDDFFFIFDLIDDLELELNIQSSNKWWKTSVSEIIYFKKVLDYDIHNSVTNFFYNNRKLLYLFDSKNKKIPIPMIYYSGTNSNYLSYMITLGIKKSDPLRSSFGPYYMVTTYERSLKFGSWNVSGGFKKLQLNNELLTDNEYGRWKNGGIVRFLVFLDKNKIILNRDWDKKNKQIDNRIEDKKLKIYDTNGNWSKDYDSVLASELLLDDNSILHLGCSVALKYPEQLYPLSYHWIDKNTIPDKYEKGCEYKIKII